MMPVPRFVSVKVKRKAQNVKRNYAAGVIVVAPSEFIQTTKG